MPKYSSAVPVAVFSVVIIAAINMIVGNSSTPVYKASLEEVIVGSFLMLAYLIDISVKTHAEFMQKEISRLIDSNTQK